MNAFLQLKEEEEERFVTHYQDEVRSKVQARLRTVHFISDVLDHFFPKLSDTVTVMMGGDVIDPEDVYLTVREEDFPDRHRPAGPGDNLDDGPIR